MLQLLRRTIVLFVLLVAPVFAARVIGSAELSPLTPLFTNANGTPCERPCLLGIRPGEMSVDQATALLKTHWFLSNVRTLEGRSYEFPLVANGKGAFAGKQFYIDLEPGPGDQKPIMVVGVGIELTDLGQDRYNQLPIASLGTYIAFFGDPETFYKTSYDDSHYFYFVQQSVQAHVVPRSRSYVALTQEVYAPSLSDQITYFQVSEPGFNGRFQKSNWCGFTRRQCEPAE